MKDKKLWAVKIRYLESEITGDGKWHTHTTGWHEKINDAWKEAEEYQNQFCYNWNESSGTLYHKEA